MLKNTVQVWRIMCNGGISWNIRQIHALQIIPVKILSPFYPASLRFRRRRCAALAGAIGIALGNMVGSLTVGKKTYAAVEKDIIQCKKKADDITARLLDLVEKDAEAFEPLSAAYGMPKSTPEEIEKNGRSNGSCLSGSLRSST